MSYLTPHASVLNTATINIATANTAQLVTFDTNIIVKKTAHSTSTNPSRITVNEAGDYIVFASLQVTSSSAGKTLDVWYRVNGTDVPNSNVIVGIVNANDHKLSTVTMVLTLTAGQYIELVMSGDSTNLSLSATTTGSSPTRPASPSIILTLDKLS
jgi:hypothetical protein